MLSTCPAQGPAPGRSAGHGASPSAHNPLLGESKLTRRLSHPGNSGSTRGNPSQRRNPVQRRQGGRRAGLRGGPSQGASRPTGDTGSPGRTGSCDWQGGPKLGERLGTQGTRELGTHWLLGLARESPGLLPTPASPTAQLSSAPPWGQGLPQLLSVRHPPSCSEPQSRGLGTPPHALRPHSAHLWGHLPSYTQRGVRSK